ncbi:MAG TPA: glycosyltransferase family 2 protein [Gaiellaceae bacterium]|jgi:GT2 family glycosyltransferase
MSLRASVVVCTYSERRWHDLVAAVHSLRTQRVEPAEIVVVVDNNAALAERVRRELPDVVAVSHGGRRGLSAARNAGVAASFGDVIAFLDDDAVADEEWLASLLRCYDDPRVGAAGGSVDAAWDGGRPGWFPQEFDWVVGCSYRGLPTSAATIRNLIGANMSFRRGVFATVGGFSVDVGRVGDRPVGCEETELCIRLRQRCPETLLVYEPRARVAHRVPEARARVGYFARRCFSEGLSKAAVVALRGGAGLQSERMYVRRVLPAGVAAAARDAVASRRASSLGRGGAIVFGLAATSAGYAFGRIRSGTS